MGALFALESAIGAKMATKKQTEAFQKYVQKVCSKLKTHFGLSLYTYRIHFFDNETFPGKPDVAAEITTDSVYLNLDIRIYSPLKDLFINPTEGKTEVFEVLVHEFCHTLTHDLVSFAEKDIHPAKFDMYLDVNEKLVQTITRMLIYWGSFAELRDSL